MTDNAVLARLDHIAADVTEIKDTVRAMNGRVRENEKSIAVLSETCLKLNVIKISAIAGVAAVVVGIVIALVSGIV